MSLSIVDFWKLVRQSKLLSGDQCQKFHSEFARNPAGENSGPALADWLVGKNVISRYQAKVLLAGQPGPFEYGEYRVYDRIESGRLGGWFRAVHAATAHPVLLQFQSGPGAQDAAAWAALAAEVEMSSGLVSAYLQQWHEAANLGSFKFLVSEDLRGGTLEERLATGRIAPPEAARLGMMTALALVQMHAAGRMHGDLRPGNLWLQPLPNHPGHLKVLRDATGGSAAWTYNPADPATAARADYLAPEFLHPGKTPDVLTDLYALGCTLYHLLTGAPPFAGGTSDQKLARHAAEPIRPLEQFGVPQPLAQLVTYLMAKNPAVRYQQAAVVAEQLTPFVDQTALYLPVPPPPPTLAAYESALQAKRQPAAVPLGMPAPVGIPVGAAVGAAGGAPLGIPVGQVAVGTAVPVSPVGVAVAAPVGAVVSVAPAGGTAIKAAPKKRKDKTVQYAVALGAVGLVAIVGLIVMNNWGGSDIPDQADANAGQVGTDTATDIEPMDIEPSEPSAGKLTKTSNSGSSSTDSGSSGTKTGELSAGNKTSADGDASPEVVPDDGQLLWASPTSGKPVVLRGVPPEGQVFLILRPAQMLATSEGKRVLDALGPGVAAARKTLEQVSGFPLDQIERLIVTFHNNEGKFPRVSCVVYPREKLTTDELLSKFGGPAAQEEKGEKVYVKDGWAFYPFLDGELPAFTMTDPETIKFVAEVKGAVPAMRIPTAKILRTTDDTRHFTVLLHPNFLENSDGAPLFQAERAKVKEPLLNLLGGDLQAAAASMHFGDQFYLEVRLAANLNKEKFQLAKEFRERVQKIPNQILDYFVALNPPLYWKKLSLKYPDMIEELEKRSRIGVEEDQAVMNCVLPGAAAHNLVLGTELAISSAAGAGATAVASTPAAGSSSKGIESTLQKKTTLSFEANSLELTMEAFAKDIKAESPEFDIKIIGKDLQLDGITKNQTIRDFMQADKPISDILTALVMKANAPNVPDASLPDQKLIWVVGPDPDNPSQQVVLITTRAAAATKKYKLPPAFQPK